MPEVRFPPVVKIELLQISASERQQTQAQRPFRPVLAVNAARSQDHASGSAHPRYAPRADIVCYAGPALVDQAEHDVPDRGER